jgi:hypothetical protein
MSEFKGQTEIINNETEPKFQNRDDFGRPEGRPIEKSLREVGLYPYTL